MSTNNKVFVDPIGRTILGELVSETDTSIHVKNPVMIVVQQTPTQQLQVQLIPLFFQEFIDAASREAGTVFEYLKANIAQVVQLNLDEKILSHYKRIFNPSSIITPNGGTGETPIIKLFED